MDANVHNVPWHGRVLLWTAARSGYRSREGQEGAQKVVSFCFLSHDSGFGDFKEFQPWGDNALLLALSQMPGLFVLLFLISS